MAKRLLIAVALALLVPATSWAQVTNVLAWAMNDSYPTAVGSQDLEFLPQSGSSDRLLVVFLSAESSTATFNLESVTYGGVVLTVGSSFVTPNTASAYGNLNWFGYLNESQLGGLTNENQPLRVNWGTPVPTGVTGDAPQIHYAIYAGVDQGDPIRGIATGGATAASDQAVSAQLGTRDGDYWIGFNLAGQPSTGDTAPGATPDALQCPSSPATWTEENEAGSGVVGNGHATAVCSLAATATQLAAPSFGFTGNPATTRRGVTAVVLRDDPIPAPTNTVEILDAWQLDVENFPTQTGYDASMPFTVSEQGVQRLVTVYVSAESNAGVELIVSSVTLGNQLLTEVHDFTAGSNTGYHDLHWFGYLDEAGITAMTGNTLTVNFGELPNDPFGPAKIFVASYENVNQTDPIGDTVSGTTGTGGDVSSLAVSPFAIGVRDLVIAFSVLGQGDNGDGTAPADDPGLSADGGATFTYTEMIQSFGDPAGSTNGSNDHSAAVYNRAGIGLDASETLTFTSGPTNRMAVSAAVLQFSGAAPVRRVMTVH